MDACNHDNVRCLNHYEIFRKYLCLDCNGVFICNCEKDILLSLFPHQSRRGTEYGTQKEFKVTGYSKVCAKCRGEREEPHPRAQIYNQKIKLDRYYWREIDFYYYTKILDYVRQNKLVVRDIFDFRNRYKEQSKQFHKESREYWKHVHNTQPLYQYNEISRDRFLKEINVPTFELYGDYIIENGIGLWTDGNGKRLTCEEYVADFYRKQGAEVYFCERRIVSTLIGAILWTPINWKDEYMQMCMIPSRGKSSKTPISDLDKRGMLWFSKPRDFGTNEFYKRRKDAIDEWLALQRKSQSLLMHYDLFLHASQRFRDYLWVNNDESEEITRVFLSVVPDAITYKVIEWAIEDFWNRRTGWPNLFVVKNKEFFFVEVKGPNDKLSPDQMRWFKWAVESDLFKCIICKVKIADKI